MFFNKQYFNDYRVYKVDIIIINDITMIIIGRETIKMK